MRTGRILNPKLAGNLAGLGHTDLILVTDVGFPIPRGGNVVDFALAPGIPTVLQILKVLRNEIFVEKVEFAREIQTHNPSLYSELQTLYTGAGAIFGERSHEQLIEKVAPAAKVIIRSADFEPWANICLTASTDPYAFFDDTRAANGLIVLDSYKERRRLIETNFVPSLDAR